VIYYNKELYILQVINLNYVKIYEVMAHPLGLYQIIRLISLLLDDFIIFKLSIYNFMNTNIIW